MSLNGASAFEKKVFDASVGGGHRCKSQRAQCAPEGGVSGSGENVSTQGPHGDLRGWPEGARAREVRALRFHSKAPAVRRL